MIFWYNTSKYYGNCESFMNHQTENEIKLPKSPAVKTPSFLQDKIKKNIILNDAGLTKCGCPSSSMPAVIIGSFRKHLDEIIEIKNKLEKCGVLILSPIDDDVVNPDDEFILFKSDQVTDPKLLQDSVFNKIKHSTFIVVANIGGYIGRAGTLEIGYAIAHGITIYTLEPVTDVHIAPYCRLITEVFPHCRLTENTTQKAVYESENQ